MDKEQILKHLPYQRPFLFVDEITSVNEKEIKGHYTFREDEFFYQGHFKDNPITPGVILTECMAQIGLVSLGIFLENGMDVNSTKIAFSSSDVHFLKMVLPGEKVWVHSVKKYFRFGKLNCDVVMTNEQDEEVCKGNLSGVMFKP